jgi:hypothetical protein
MNTHLVGIETKIELYERGLVDAREQLSMVEDMFQNSAAILGLISPEKNEEGWIEADKMLMVWTEEHLDALNEVQKCEAMLQILLKRHRAVKSLIHSDPLA